MEKPGRTRLAFSVLRAVADNCPIPLHLKAATDTVWVRMLDRERQYYDQHLDEWLSSHPGKFVLVKGEELIGVFDSVEDALSEGARRYGLEPFLVREVKEAEGPVYIPALALGLLRADSTRTS